MQKLIDLLFIFFSSIILFKAYKKVIFNPNSSIANFIIIVVYIFNVLPIIFNYIIGIPSYNSIYWYKPFIIPMESSKIALIYDIYILSSLVGLNIYACKNNTIDNNNAKSYQFIFNNNLISFLAILSPLILVIITGTWKNFLVFNVSRVRGLSESTSASLITPLLLLSTFTFFSKFYNNKDITFKKIVISFIYFFIIVWLSGKRFMIANLVILLIFYISKSNIEKNARKKIFRILPIVFVVIIVFSGFYLSTIRQLKDNSFIGIYDMLRVDFGRDDVVKYVIYEELFRDNMILNYRFQSIISLFLFFVPRSIWPNKPYPHYMYLTGHLLNLNILKLPAGTTPSWYEMCLCNFGIFGFLIAVISLILFCKIADHSKSVDGKSIYLILIIAILTQSMDVYYIYIFIIVLINILNTIFKGKKIIFIK